MIKQINRTAQCSGPGHSNVSRDAAGGSILESGGHFALGLENGGAAEPVGPPNQLAKVTGPFPERQYVPEPPS